MASSNPPDTTMNQQVRIHSAYESFKHNASITMLVLAPVLVLIPPRKLDLYTFSLAGAFIASANQLTVERTGRGLISQFGYSRMSSRGFETQNRFKEEDLWRISSDEKAGVPNEILRRNAGTKDSIAGKAKEVWMGGEPTDWKEKRLKEEQEKLNQGEGYGGMIVDQIWEVWNQGDKKAGGLQTKDEETLQEKNGETDSKKGS